jgi:tetratricopeptide (TPR) repeat protein
VVSDAPVRQTADEGRRLYRQGEYVEAARAFEEALSQVPADRRLEAVLRCEAGQAWWAQAARLLTNGRRDDAGVLLERALGHYRSAAMVDPRLEGAYYGAADVVRQWGRHDLALEIIEKRKIPDRMPAAAEPTATGAAGSSGR